MALAIYKSIADGWQVTQWQFSSTVAEGYLAIPHLVCMCVWLDGWMSHNYLFNVALKPLEIGIWRKLADPTKPEEHYLRREAERWGTALQYKVGHYGQSKTVQPYQQKVQIVLKGDILIMFMPESPTLNSTNKLFNTCRHRKQKLLDPQK